MIFHLPIFRVSGTSLLVADCHIHAVVLVDIVSSFLIVCMSLKSTARSVHTVCSSARSRHTWLSGTVDLLAFNDSEILSSIHRSVRTIVTARIGIECIVQALSDFPHPCLSDIGH